MLYVESYFKSIPSNAIVIDTTSRSTNWTKGLSPFILKGGHLYKEYYSKNVENAWQASKVYSEFLDKNGNPSEEYFKWALNIWNSDYAYRYPMGKGRIPEYSYWDGEKLSYVEARKKIYIPIYSRAVKESDAFKKLIYLYKNEEKDIYLIDFDGYNHVKINKTLDEVINDPNKKMGHAFVIYAILTEIIKKKEMKIKELF
jgi:hypothetical protein